MIILTYNYYFKTFTNLYKLLFHVYSLHEQYLLCSHGYKNLLLIMMLHLIYPNHPCIYMDKHILAATNKLTDILVRSFVYIGEFLVLVFHQTFYCNINISITTFITVFAFNFMTSFGKIIKKI